MMTKERPRAGLTIRCRGEDSPSGEAPLPVGHLLTAPRLALLAATGIAEVEVFAKLRVGLRSTGSELQKPGATLAHGQIYNSNLVMLRALLASHWIVVTDYGILPDDPATIRSAARENGVVISSGGVSAGEVDHVGDVSVNQV